MLDEGREGDSMVDVGAGRGKGRRFNGGCRCWTREGDSMVDVGAG